MERKDIREPWYTDEEIEKIIERHIKSNYPEYASLTEEQFVVPLEAWKGILDAFRSIARASFRAALSEEIDYGDINELEKKYELIWKGNEEGSHGWCSIYTDKEGNYYQIIKGEGVKYDVLYKLGYLPYVEEC